MIKFICKNQSMSVNNIRGPSGLSYTSYLGQSFSVKNKMDIEFFSKKVNRYQKVNIIENILGVGSKQTPQVDKEKELRVNLEMFGLFDKKVIDIIVQKYYSKDELFRVIDKGYKLSSQIPKKDRETLVALIKGEKHVSENKKVIKKVKKNSEAKGNKPNAKDKAKK